MSYKVNWPAEAAWTGVLGSGATLAGLLMEQAGVDPGIAAAAIGFGTGIVRILIGMFLPTPGGA